MHPFRWVQNKLGIAREWQAFKQNLRPHKYTLILLTGVVTYPFYKNYLISTKNLIKNKTNQWLEEYLLKNQNIDNAIQNYSKYLVQQIINDQKVIQETSKFSQKVFDQDLTKEAAKTLLLKVIRSKQFEDQAEFLSKDIAKDLLEDKEIQKKSENLVDRILGSQKVQTALESSLMQVIDTKQMQEMLEQLFEKTFQEEKFQASVSELLDKSLGDILNNPETAVKLKNFVGYLMDTNFGSKSKKFQSNYNDSNYNNQNVNKS